MLGEIENVLKIDCAPITWPVGMGKTFRGVFSLLDNRMKRFTPGGEKLSDDVEVIEGLGNPRLDELFPLEMDYVRESIELIQGAVSRSLLNGSWKAPRHRFSSAPVSTTSVSRTC